jgi:hypothetical protein
MRSDWELAHKLDQLLVSVADKVRPLPSLTAEDAAQERARLLCDLERGEVPVPAPQQRRTPAESGVFRLLDQGRRLAEQSELGPLYLERFDELELDLAILAAFGDPKQARTLSARRYGTGHESVSLPASVAAGGPTLSVGVLARQLLDQLTPCDMGPRVLPAAAAPGKPSVARLVLRAAAGIGLDPSVRVEPRLASLAATGERTVFLSERLYSLHEARRLVAHEVFGHLVVAANARAQPLRLLSVGLAGAFADQEGVSLYLEAALGLMSSERLRILAARVMATQWLHAGASFGETARRLYDDHALSAESAILTAERTYRGGGVARDAGYLAGFVRVRAALAAGAASLDELRRGRVSLGHVASLRRLERAGWLRTPCYRPSLALSRSLTFGGTSAETSPPSDAASLTMLELT